MTTAACIEAVAWLRDEAKSYEDLVAEGQSSCPEVALSMAAERRRWADSIDQLAALATQASAVPAGWQPISSAPKDGTPILVICDDALGPSPGVAHFHEQTWRAGSASDWESDPDAAMEDLGVYPSPTRWCAFSAAPQPKEPQP